MFPAGLILWQSAVQRTRLPANILNHPVKRSVKAALLSGLAFPGLGHIYLKRFATGSVLILIASIATYYIIANAVHVAFSISDKITAGDVPLDESSIGHLLSQQSQQVALSSNLATFALGVAWLIGIIDSYRVGIALERGQTKSFQK